MWKKLMKHVDIDEPTSLLDHVYLGCNQRECKPNEIIMDEYKDVKYFVQQHLKITGMGKPVAKTMAMSSDMEGHAQKRLNVTVNWQTSKYQFKQEEVESVGELSEVCSQIVLKCLYLASTGRPHILWAVNKLVRSVTKMDSGM